MNTLTIEKKDAVTAFMQADEKGRSLLKALFPGAGLTGNVKDIVKTIEDAIALDSGWTDADEKWLQAVKAATIVTRVLNGPDWKPDYSNKNQPKYYVWMEYDRAAAAFRFYYTTDGYTLANSHTGSRHVFKDAETAKYFATQFCDLINTILLQ